MKRRLDGSRDVYIGTLEQTCSDRFGPWVASTGRLAAALVEGLAVFNVLALAGLADGRLYRGIRWRRGCDGAVGPSADEAR